MRTIKCDECGKELFKTEEKSFGAIGVEANNKGFFYKIPLLFTDKYDRLFFCSKECTKSFYDKNIPKNEEATNVLNQMKKDIPKRTKEICKGLSDIQKKLKKIIWKKL